MSERIPHGRAALDALPTTGRLLGVDLGDVRIGLSVTDDGQRVATPLATAEAGGDLQVVSALADTAIDQAAVGIVVGYPRTLQGREGRAAARARRIATALRDATHLPVVLWDERFTTVEAERVMLDQDASRRERRAHVDRVAATLILQGVVQARSGGDAPWR